MMSQEPQEQRKRTRANLSKLGPNLIVMKINFSGVFLQ